VTPLVNSSKNSYGETTPDRAEFDAGRDLPGPLTLMVLVNRRPVTSGDTVAMLSGRQDDRPAARTDGKDATPVPRVGPSRIAVVGDSTSHSILPYPGHPTCFNTVNYLVAQENLIGIEPRTYDLPWLTHNRD
jgi:hypothetical protein